MAADQDTAAQRLKWDTRFRDAPYPAGPARVLVDFGHLLPTHGTALDLACGLGANALHLAARGLHVQAWDLSPVALERLQDEARRRGLAVDTRAVDLTDHPPPAAAFDVIVVAHFLDRALCPAIAAALRPGGLLFYQTFTRERVTDIGPKDPAYRLAPNELLGLFADLRVLAYREEGRVGDPALGMRDEAYLVGQR